MNGHTPYIFLFINNLYRCFCFFHSYILKALKVYTYIYICCYTILDNTMRLALTCSILLPFTTLSYNKTLFLDVCYLCSSYCFHGCFLFPNRWMGRLTEHFFFSHLLFFLLYDIDLRRVYFWAKKKNLFVIIFCTFFFLC